MLASLSILSRGRHAERRAPGCRVTCRRFARLRPPAARPKWTGADGRQRVPADSAQEPPLAEVHVVTAEKPGPDHPAGCALRDPSHCQGPACGHLVTDTQRHTGIVSV